MLTAPGTIQLNQVWIDGMFDRLDLIRQKLSDPQLHLKMAQVDLQMWSDLNSLIGYIGSIEDLRSNGDRT